MELVNKINTTINKKLLMEIYPNKGESKKDFIARFMSVTKNEYPDAKQRFAIANSYWNRRKLKEELIEIDIRPWEQEDILYWYNPTEGTCNAIIEYKGKKTRVRSGLLIVNKDKVLLCQENGVFSLPGGSLNPGETIINAAKREAQEEVCITAKNIKETGFDYCLVNEELEDWVIENVPEKYQWYNYYTCLCIGEYEDKYTKAIAKVDQDPEMKNSAEWYLIDSVINNPSFIEPWRQALIKFGYYNKILTEDTRGQQISQSRNAGIYQNISRGKNRFERKRYSRIASQVKSYNQIDMNNFFKKDILEVNIPIIGETDSYTVTIKLEGVCEELSHNIKNNGYKLEFKTILQAITKIFNTKNIYVKCTCADYCLHPDTKIKLLNGETVTVEKLESMVKNATNPIYLYSVDDAGDFKPGKIKDVWVSNWVDHMLKITLDNGKELITTDDHPYMLRNGQYKSANELQVGQSLMPLYFGQTANGYETVKANSKATTEFYSTYKQVAQALLQKEIEAAKVRSGEEKIAIHHKDFNKNNNSPENLSPMGFNEHYKYHYEHVFDSGSFDKFKAAGEDYRKLVMDHNTPEYQKQAQVMSQAISNYWQNLSDEQRQLDSKRKSNTSKQAWANGSYNTTARKVADEHRRTALHTPEMETKTKAGIQQYWANLSPAEREEVIKQRTQNLAKGAGWNKGAHLSDEDKLHKSLAALNKTPEEKAEHNIKIRDTKMLRVFNKMLEDKVALTAENYEKYRQSYFKYAAPLEKYFSSIEDAINYFKLNHKIIKIERVDYDMLQPVYDIEVENYHNFYVDAGVILHNCYRFAHWNIVNNISVDDTSKDPGPGKGIQNPNNDKGRGCKHILLVLANTDWIMKVTSVVTNYIHWMEEHETDLFIKIIFPKLYGVPIDEASEQGILPEDIDLKSEKHIIDTINEWAKNRGKYQKGSNKNPVTGTGGRANKINK